MSRQTTMDAFLKRKLKANYPKPSKGGKSKGKHNSSRECSDEDTVRLPDDQSEVQLELFEKISPNVNHQLVLMTPNCMQHFNLIKGKLERLEQNYGKEEAIAFIEGNLRFHKADNTRNLDKIDDDDFWCLALPKLIQLLTAHLPKLDPLKFRILRQGSNQVIALTRLDVLLLLGCMFLGIMPKQEDEEGVSFGQLMMLRQNEYVPARAVARREKLKCFLTYFKVMTKNDALHDETIRIQRTANLNFNYLEVHNMDRELPLRSVEFHLLENKTIEDFCGKSIMVDFANKRLGGGVLKNGCVQQEILFAIFPQLIVTKLLCEELEDNEAVIVYGARRFSRYSGYSDTFEFEDEFPLQSNKVVERSVMVAIDALDFNKYPSEGYQYSKKGVRREINKAYTGFQGANLDADESMKICTGKWGCGAFKGDEDLKFLIQWLAASEANREMVYITDTREKQEEYQILVKELAQLTTLDLLSLLDQFYRMRNKSPSSKLAVLEYIKQFG